MTKDILRGELWLINFDPTIGSEINKTGPGIVISVSGVGALPVRIVVPVTAWKPEFRGNIWHIFLSPSAENGLLKDSAADILQVRSIDRRRFIKKIGSIEKEIVDEMAYGIMGLISEE